MDVDVKNRYRDASDPGWKIYTRLGPAHEVKLKHPITLSPGHEKPPRLRVPQRQIPNPTESIVCHRLRFRKANSG